MAACRASPRTCCEPRRADGVWCRFGEGGLRGERRRGWRWIGARASERGKLARGRQATGARASEREAQWGLERGGAPSRRAAQRSSRGRA
jgi:hypothetical protein